ncbi:MAG: transcriptional repressor [Pirellulales bacterium]|nr:transcriptional repressor [Pirellulales bacterium]
MSHRKLPRNTRQREVILEELRKLTSHPTATGLYAMVRRRLPKVSLGTVYRNLELLVQQGVIRKLEFSGSEARFDGNTEQHDHIRCVRCGRMDDLGGGPLELTDGKHHDCDGYKVLGYRLVLLGVCPRCNAERAGEDAEASPGEEE